MSRLQDYEDYVRQRIELDHVTLDQLAEELRRHLPSGVRGFSVCLLRRFCLENGIHKTSRLTQAEVKTAVANAVEKVFACSVHCFPVSISVKYSCMCHRRVYQVINNFCDEYIACRSPVEIGIERNCMQPRYRNVHEMSVCSIECNIVKAAIVNLLLTLNGR